MKLRSLGWRTDLLFPPFDGEVVDHLVIVADPGDAAIALHRAAGFNEVESIWQLQLRAPQDRAGAG